MSSHNHGKPHHKSPDPKATPLKSEVPPVTEAPKDASSQPSTGATAGSTPEPTLKAEEPENAVAQDGADPRVPPAHESPKKAEESEGKKPFTVQIPVGTMKLLGVISRAEGKPISEIILQALAHADLKGRARKALEALAREIE